MARPSGGREEEEKEAMLHEMRGVLLHVSGDMLCPLPPPLYTLDKKQTRS